MCLMVLLKEETGSPSVFSMGLRHLLVFREIRCHMSGLLDPRAKGSLNKCMKHVSSQPVCSVKRMGEKTSGGRAEHLLSAGYPPQPPRAQLSEQRKQRALVVCGSGSLGAAVRRSAT